MKKQQFKPRTTFTLLSWNCSMVYFITGYLLAIPGSSEVTWQALSRTFMGQEINSIYQSYAFAIGAILSLGFEITGNLRMKITKCDIALCIIFLVQPFTPLALGTLIARFIQGGILSLNMRYSESYLQQISQPLLMFQKQHYQGKILIQSRIGNPYYGMKLFSQFTVSLYAGWTLCMLYGVQLPQTQDLIHIKHYDDTLLWMLLNSFPVVLVAVRLINMNLTFPFNTIQENSKHQDLNEHFVANIFKKRDFEMAWDMLYTFRLECGIFKEIIKDAPYIKTKYPIYLINIVGQLGGSMLLILNSYDLLFQTNIEQQYVVHVQLMISTSGLLGILIISQNKLKQQGSFFKRLAFELIYILSLVGSFIFSLAYSIFITTESIELAILSLMGLAFVNGSGLSHIGYSINYYIQLDEQFVFRISVIRQVSLLALLFSMSLLGSSVIFITIMTSLFLCFYFCNSFSRILIELETTQFQDKDEIAQVLFDVLEDQIEDEIE